VNRYLRPGLRSSRTKEPRAVATGCREARRRWPSGSTRGADRRPAAVRWMPLVGPRPYSARRQQRSVACCGSGHGTASRGTPADWYRIKHRTNGAWMPALKRLRRCLTLRRACSPTPLRRLADRRPDGAGDQLVPSSCWLDNWRRGTRWPDVPADHSALRSEAKMREALDWTSPAGCATCCGSSSFHG